MNEDNLKLSLIKIHVRAFFRVFIGNLWIIDNAPIGSSPATRKISQAMEKYLANQVGICADERTELVSRDSATFDLSQRAYYCLNALTFSTCRFLLFLDALLVILKLFTPFLAAITFCLRRLQNSSGEWWSPPGMPLMTKAVAYNK